MFNWYKKGQYEDDEDLNEKLIKMHELEYMYSTLDNHRKNTGWLPDSANLFFLQTRSSLYLTTENILNEMIPEFERWVARHFDKDAWLCEFTPSLAYGNGKTGNQSYQIDIYEEVKEELNEALKGSYDFKEYVEESYFRSNVERIANAPQARNLVRDFFLEENSILQEAKEYFEEEEVPSDLDKFIDIFINNEGYNLGEFLYEHHDSEFMEFAKEIYGDLNPLDEDMSSIDFDIEEIYGSEWWESFISSGEVFCDDGDYSGEIGSYFHVLEEVAWDVGYPQWMSNFPGMESVEEAVKESSKRMESAQSSEDLKEKVIAITMALNTAHYFGNMSEHVGLSQGDLDALSNLDFTEQDMILKKKGITPPSQQSREEEYFESLQPQESLAFNWYPKILKYAG